MTFLMAKQWSFLAKFSGIHGLFLQIVSAGSVGREKKVGLFLKPPVIRMDMPIIKGENCPNSKRKSEINQQITFNIGNQAHFDFKIPILL